jgi:hypothetical protein
VEGRNVYRLALQHQPKVSADEVRLRITLPDGASDVRAKAFTREGNVLIWEHSVNRDVELEISWLE